MLLQHQLAKQGSNQRDDHQRRIAALEKAIADLTRRQDNLLTERENKTPNSHSTTTTPTATSPAPTPIPRQG